MKLKINGQECEFTEGETLLNIARRNEIFIPAICYLGGCSPTLACRMCMIEEGGKRSYACNTRAKEGMEVLSDTPALWEDRREIMEAYCLNHPLECGVCDKSGECELQNFTHKARVNSQKMWIKDTHKPQQKWGRINYDPALCIVCERCVTVCKDKIGEAALKTVPRGGEAIAPSFKDSLGKDAFAVWSKFQKSLIGPAAEKGPPQEAGGNAAILDCSYCGECTSVCPTGALIGADFQYSSNIWELTRIPASNPHSSDCELLYYDVKQEGIAKGGPRIYRVSNDFSFATLNQAARYGFDTAVAGSREGERGSFERLVRLIKTGQIKSIRFNSFITNEEALILQKLAAKYSLALINEEARIFQTFLHAFIASAGGMYSASSEELAGSDFIISLGSLLRYDAPSLSYKLNNALVMNKGAGIYFHPLRDLGVEKYSKNFIQINHAPGAEEKILRFILARFTGEHSGQNSGQDSGEDTQATEDAGELAAQLGAELGIDEGKLKDLLLKKSNFALIIGPDLYFHPDAARLAALAGAIQRATPFKIFILPTHTNTLGVALICELTAKKAAQPGLALGYNEPGDFAYSYTAGSDLAAASLTQQEGTFTNYDKRVVPTNAALEFGGYFLNDLARALGLAEEHTVDYTKRLPAARGFRPLDFDRLDNFYDNGGVNHRGYKLNEAVFDCEPAAEKSPADSGDAAPENNPPQEAGDEILIYSANPPGLFGKFSNRSPALREELFVGLSQAVAEGLGLGEGEAAKIIFAQGELTLSVKIDTKLATGAYLPYFDEAVDTLKFFTQRFAQAKIIPAKQTPQEAEGLSAQKIIPAQKGQRDE